MRMKMNPQLLKTVLKKGIMSNGSDKNKEING